MKNIILFLSVVCAALGIYACQETDAVFFDEPRVRMVLYNSDSLSEIANEIIIIDSDITRLKIELTKIDSVAKLLVVKINRLDSLITAGNLEFKPELDEVKLSYDQKLLDYEAQKKIQEKLNKDKLEWQKIATKINSGLMMLSSITNLNSKNQTVIYEGSAKFWPLPLDMNHDSVKLALEIDGVKYLLGLTYDRHTILDDLSRLTVESSSLKLIEYDDSEYEKTGTKKFESVKLKCKTLECIDNEASIAIYY